MKIYVEEGTILDDAVNKLLEASSKGNQACVEFNGIKLEENTVTIDSAYKEDTGYTKKEFDELPEELKKGKNIKLKRYYFDVGTDFDAAINELLQAQARGEQVYGEFNGIMFYSDGLTIDSAYIKYFGCTKEERDKKKEEENKIFEEEWLELKQKIKKYKNMIEQSRRPGESVVITMPIVIEGLKFIAENQMLNHEDLIKGLIDLGCNFNDDDIKKQFCCWKIGDLTNIEDIKKGELLIGAEIILYMRFDEETRKNLSESLLDVDNEYTIYNYIRVVTGDQNYTRDNLYGSKNSKIIKR